MEPEANLNWQIGFRTVAKGQVTLDSDSAVQGTAGAAERNHEPIALDFDLMSPRTGDSLANDAVVLPKDVHGPPVAQLLGDRGESFDIAEHDGDRALGQLPVLEL